MSRRASLVLLNTFSLTRLPLALLFVWLESPLARVLLVVIAALTDFLDGWIARHKHLESYWGALIDPLADRAFVMVALFTFMVEGRLTPLAFGVLVVRDVATGLAFIVTRMVPRLRPVRFQARMLGKVVTTLQLAALLAVLLAPGLVVPLVVAVGLMSLASVVDYAAVVWRSAARLSAGGARLPSSSRRRVA
ncbi:CDP-alcohol phosphatidyltransferase family protein [Melittangium boletus]|uniref:CDP-diacylglycerol--glycerol-3-phosphate 3-phosphatidyltransferase n=1 Tax=Melittangium boletus DSM 14713 TaxID=1294270 RepID=A0A250IBG8_9BACT|nr:CDP-alcohol phosphatidyltransferase family protein [Melittangium boletus]ATB29189.1 CDP-alcohol phosphatidyltransferase family protein [Melittangium boletus DSM 14713]